LKKTPSSLVQYLPDTVSKGQVNFCGIFTKLKKDLDPCFVIFDLCLILACFGFGGFF